MLSATPQSSEVPGQMAQHYQFADGFDRPDQVALGLTAPQLLVVVAGAGLAQLLLRTDLPWHIGTVAAVAVAVTAAVLGWGRLDGRPILTWAYLATTFLLQPRQLTIDLAIDQTDTAAGPEAPEETDADVARELTAEPDAQSELPDQPWTRWLQPVTTSPDSEPPQLHEQRAEDAKIEPNRDSPERPFLLDPAEARLFHDPLVAGPDDDFDDEDDSADAVILPFTRSLADDGEEIDLLDDETPMSMAPPAIAHSAAPMFAGATRRVAFFALNGGTGRTTLATEVAGVLAARGRHSRDGVNIEPLKVALLDLDLVSATVAVRLGIPHPTVWDYVMRDATIGGQIQDYLVTHRSGLRALIGPPKPLLGGRGVEPAAVAEIVQQLESDGYHFIVFDVSADLSAVTTWVLEAVHDIFVVLTPTASGAQDAYRTTEVLRRMGLRHKLSYVVNRGRDGVDMREVMGDLGGQVRAVIPYDLAVEDAENDHRLASLGTGPAANAIAELAAHLYPALQVSPARRRVGLPWRRRAG